MIKTLFVTYDGEVLRPDEPLDLEPNKHYEISVNGTNGVRNPEGILPNNGVVTKSSAEESGAAANSPATELTSITITLAASQVRELVALAEQLGVSAELLVRSSIKELLMPMDHSYQQGTEYLLAENAELLRRLA